MTRPTHGRTLAVSPAAPTKELGLARNEPPPASFGNIDLGWLSYIDDLEYVPELKWPASRLVFDQMRTDSQLSGLKRAMTFPIRRFKWLIDPNGAPPVLVNGVADDLGLDVQGQDPRPRGRRKNRFSFDDFLYHALLALEYGHIGFNQAGSIIDAPEFPGGQRWKLTKLLPLMPKTIGQINVAADGGLISVRQNLTRSSGASFLGSNGLGGNPPIPVENLVWFPWEKEGANWVGRSLYRDCFKNWLIKDRLLKVDAINHERAGGVPIATAQPGASPAEVERLSKLAQNFNVAEGAGGALVDGAKLELYKIGSGTDVIGSIRYHDEAMAKLFLHMFIQLGQTETGSRALGQVFIEYAFIAQKAVAQWFVDIVNEHVIEDWVEWNWDNDNDTAPLLTYVVEDQDEHIAVTELVALITAGAITVDPELEDSLRERYKLPPRDETVNQPPAGISAKQWDALKAQMGAEIDAVLLEAAENADLSPSGLSARLRAVLPGRR